MDIQILLEQLHVSFHVYRELPAKSTFTVRPKSTAEVSCLLKSLRTLVEQKEVAIFLQPVGSKPFSGEVDAAATVTIDLRLLKGISLNQEKTMINIHVGETWSSIQHELERHDLTTLGESAPFYLKGRGVSLDSLEIQEFEVVLASGDVLRVNESGNTSLFETIKGKPNNNAIVTSIKARAFRAVHLSGGIAHFVSESFSLLAEAIVLFAKSEPVGKTCVMFSAGYGYGRRLNTCCCFPAEDMENDPFLQPLISLPGRVQDYPTLQNVADIAIFEDLDSVQADVIRSLIATFSIRPDLALILDVHQEWLKVSHSLEDIDGHLCSIAFSPITNDYMRQAGDITPGDRGLFTVMLSSVWKSPADDTRVREGIDMILAKSWAMSRERNSQHDSVFTDYAHYSGSVLHIHDEKSSTFLR